MTEQDQNQSIHPQVISGHTSFETAYLIGDYPYGSLRCQKKVWIEVGTRGRTKGQMRIASCTSNPKKRVLVWNQTHYSTYSDFELLYIDPNTGYLENDGVTCYRSLERLEKFKAKWYHLMDEVTRTAWDAYEKVRRNLVEPTKLVKTSEYPVATIAPGDADAQTLEEWAQQDAADDATAQVQQALNLTGSPVVATDLF